MDNYILLAIGLFIFCLVASVGELLAKRYDWNKMQKYRITAIHEDDQFYSYQERIIGMVGEAYGIEESNVSNNTDGWVACNIKTGKEYYYFFAVKLEPVPNNA